MNGTQEETVEYIKKALRAGPVSLSALASRIGKTKAYIGKLMNDRSDVFERAESGSGGKSKTAIWKLRESAK